MIILNLVPSWQTHKTSSAMILVNTLSIVAVAKAARLGQDSGLDGPIEGSGFEHDEDPQPPIFDDPGHEEDSAAADEGNNTIDEAVDENEARWELFPCLSFTLITQYT